MNEFLKLTWRKNITDEELDRKFLTDEAVSDLYVYKSFDKPIKAKVRKNVKLRVSNEKFVPGLKYYRQIKRRSVLTKIQKSHCLDALKLIQSGKRQDLLTQKEKYSLKIYNECHPKIVEENRLFNDHIKNVWLKHKDKHARTKAGIFNFAWSNWKKKFGRYLEYPQFYKECNSLCLNFDESQSTIDFQHVAQPLETGTLARYAHTNLKEECILKLNTLKKMAKETLLNSKLPVSQDDNVVKLLEKHDFHGVISSSALKQIIDYTNTKHKWIIPVVIREVEIDKDGKQIKKKVVFIDKVLPKPIPTIHDLNVYTYKRLLKLNFCQYEAFSYPVEEVPIESPQEEHNEEEEEEEHNPDETKEATSNTVTTDEENSKPKQVNNRVIHHNVNYRIWSIKKTTIQNTLMKNQIKEKDLNLLVRCKLDGCEETEQGVLYPVIVRPKIEQQIQYGANIPSKTELAHDWTSLFFRLYSVAYRARIYKPMNEIIAVEKCSIQKINSEAHTHYDYKPILGLGVLQKVLSHLVEGECGTYLLYHLPKNESFLSVMKQCDDNTENSFDLHRECSEIRVDTTTPQSWLPVDVNYILPAHEEYHTIPGLFHGFDNAQNSSNKVAKSKKRTKKKRPRNFL